MKKKNRNCQRLKYLLYYGRIKSLIPVWDHKVITCLFDQTLGSKQMTYTLKLGHSVIFFIYIFKYQTMYFMVVSYQKVLLCCVVVYNRSQTFF